jgi:hypothetical protein
VGVTVARGVETAWWRPFGRLLVVAGKTIAGRGKLSLHCCPKSERIRKRGGHVFVVLSNGYGRGFHTPNGRPAFYTLQPDNARPPPGSIAAVSAPVRPVRGQVRP